MRKHSTFKHINLPSQTAVAFEPNPKFKVLARFRVGIIYYMHIHFLSQRTCTSREQSWRSCLPASPHAPTTSFLHCNTKPLCIPQHTLNSDPFLRQVASWPARFLGDEECLHWVCIPGKRIRLNKPLLNWDPSGGRQQLTETAKKVLRERGSSSTDVELPWVRAWYRVHGIGLGRFGILMNKFMLLYCVTTIYLSLKAERSYGAQQW